MSKAKYTPKPIDTSDIQLPEELNPLLEAMAKNVHEIWAQERMSQGWTYGEKRDDTLKHHPCLVAYEDLPEEEKKAGEQKKEAQKVPDNETLKNLAETNAENVEKYSKRREEDENNLAALLHLGETYMNSGYSAMNGSTTDEEKEYSKGLLSKATEYFDRYLKLNDSVTVKIDRTLVEYYAGDTDKAVADLKKI